MLSCYGASITGSAEGGNKVSRYNSYKPYVGTAAGILVAVGLIKWVMRDSSNEEDSKIQVPSCSVEQQGAHTTVEMPNDTGIGCSEAASVLSCCAFGASGDESDAGGYGIGVGIRAPSNDGSANSSTVDSSRFYSCCSSDSETFEPEESKRNDACHGTCAKEHNTVAENNITGSGRDKINLTLKTSDHGDPNAQSGHFPEEHSDDPNAQSGSVGHDEDITPTSEGILSKSWKFLQKKVRGSITSLTGSPKKGTDASVSLAVSQSAQGKNMPYTPAHEEHLTPPNDID